MGDGGGFFYFPLEDETVSEKILIWLLRKPDLKLDEDRIGPNRSLAGSCNDGKRIFRLRINYKANCRHVLLFQVYPGFDDSGKSVDEIPYFSELLTEIARICGKAYLKPDDEGLFEYLT